MNFVFKGEIIEYEFFKVNNSNTLILFLHGWGGNKNSFLSSINLLKSKHNILTLTLPTIKPTTASWELMDYVNLILQILKIYNYEKLIIVCHSFGFRLACVLQNFLNFDKLIVTGGAGIKLIKKFKNIENNNAKLLLNDVKNQYLLKKIASKDYLSLSKTNQKTFKNIVNTNLKKLISFDCRLLIFWGKNDKETPFKFAKIIKAKNNAELIKTDGDHFTYLTKNSYFNNELINFINL